MDAVNELAIGGVWQLREEYYDAEVGVVLEGQRNNFASV